MLPSYATDIRPDSSSLPELPPWIPDECRLWLLDVSGRVVTNQLAEAGVRFGETQDGGSHSGPVAFPPPLVQVGSTVYRIATNGTATVVEALGRRVLPGSLVVSTDGTTAACTIPDTLPPSAGPDAPPRHVAIVDGEGNLIHRNADGVRMTPDGRLLLVGWDDRHGTDSPVRRTRTFDRMGKLLAELPSPYGAVPYGVSGWVARSTASDGVAPPAIAAFDHAGHRLWSSPIPAGPGGPESISPGPLTAYGTRYVSHHFIWQDAAPQEARDGQENQFQRVLLLDAHGDLLLDRRYPVRPDSLHILWELDTAFTSDGHLVIASIYGEQSLVAANDRIGRLRVSVFTPGDREPSQITEMLLAKPVGNLGGISAAARSDRLVVWMTGSVLLVLDPGAEPRRFTFGPAQDVQLSPDGRLLFVSDDDYAALYRIPDQAPSRRR